MDRHLEAKLARIQRLMENAGTDGEAEAAALAFQRLITRFNLEDAQFSDNHEDAYEAKKVRVAQDRTDSVAWRTQLIHVLATYNFCKIVAGTGRVNNVNVGRGKGGDGGGIVTLIGQPKNTDAVKRLFSSMAPRLEFLAERGYRHMVAEFKRDHPQLAADGLYKQFVAHKRSWMTSWLRGFPSGLYDKLKEERARELDDTDYTGLSALVVVKSDALRKATQELVGRTRKGHSTAASDADAFQRGYQTGKAWNTAEPVSATVTRALGQGVQS